MASDIAPTASANAWYTTATGSAMGSVAAISISTLRCSLHVRSVRPCGPGAISSHVNTASLLLPPTAGFNLLSADTSSGRFSSMVSLL